MNTHPTEESRIKVRVISTTLIFVYYAGIPNTAHAMSTDDVICTSEGIALALILNIIRLIGFVFVKSVMLLAANI